MPHFPHINIDRISFWVGFFSALLVVWFYSRIQRWFPGWKKFFQNWIAQLKTHWIYRLENKLRDIIYSRAQKEHLAISICVLDEIIIPPELLIPPQSESSTNGAPTLTIKEQAIPFLPDYPELSSQFSLETISPFKAINACNRVIICGQAGYGKTVSLAYMTSMIAKKSEIAGDLAQFLPLFMHCRDFSWVENRETTSIQRIFEAFTQSLPKNIQKDSKRVLDHFLKNGQIILLIDGMDELSPDEYQSCAGFIGRLLVELPNLPVVTSATPQLLGGLIELGFEPFPIACWNKTKKAEFITKWLDLLAPHIIEQSQNTIDLTIFSTWLKSHSLFHSPLEWTMLILSAVTGNSLQSTKTQILQTYLAPIMRKANLGKYARSIIEGGLTAQPSQQSSPLTPDSQAIDLGVIRQNFDGNYFFRCPVFTGFFASRQGDSPITPDFKDIQFNPAYEQLGFMASRDLIDNQFLNTISSDEIVRQPQILSSLRWLRDYPENHPSRVAIMRKMVGWLHDESLDLITRTKIVAAFLTINDSSISLLFRQISKSKTEAMKYLSLLGLGAIGDDTTLVEIQRLLSDESTLVRDTACLALQSFNSPASRKSLQQVFEHGDEDQQFAAAEVLADDQKNGHNALLEGLNNESLLIRRAAVHGLAQIHQEWITKKLEEVSISDGQWVVRDLAAQYLAAYKSNQYPPISRPVESSSSPWLIEYASKQGITISPNTPADELLGKIINEGPDELRPKAYLQIARYSKISNALAIITNSTVASINHADFINYCLWLLSARNVNNLKYS
jgi:hypothetical protein